MADRAYEQRAAASPRPAGLAPARLEAAWATLRALPLTAAQRTALFMAAAAGAVLIVQAPVLGHYFFGDDFVPLADIASRSTWGYARDLFLLRDLTPNWRFLTGIFYLAAYKAFGLNAFPYLLAAVLVHTATALLVFWLGRRALGSDWAAVVAAGFFGMSAAPVPTVGHVTAFNNVLGAFFVMLAVVALYEGLDRRERRGWWIAAAAVSYAAAIASNESAAVIAPVFGLIALWKAGGAWREPRFWTNAALVSTPFAALGVAGLAGFGACGCTEAEIYVRGDHIESNIWLYLGRLLYPVGLEFPGHVGTAHTAAGWAVLAVGAVALLRGPTLARISAVFLAVAIVPHLPIEIWSAPRYTYLASVPFALLAGVFFWELGRYGARLSPLVPPAVAAVALGVLALHGWQSWLQNDQHDAASERYRSLVAALQGAYDAVPAKSTVYLRGGPVTDELSQCSITPSIGRVLWGDAKLFTFPEGRLIDYRIRPGYRVYVGDWVDGRIVPAPLPIASEADLQRSDLWLLPHVSPDATGNVCRLDVPLPP